MSEAPFHQRMTALVDARSCNVFPRAWFRLAAPTETAGAVQLWAQPESADARADLPVGVDVEALSA